MKNMKPPIFSKALIFVKYRAIMNVMEVINTRETGKSLDSAKKFIL